MHPLQQVTRGWRHHQRLKRQRLNPHVKVYHPVSLLHHRNCHPVPALQRRRKRAVLVHPPRKARHGEEHRRGSLQRPSRVID